MTERAKFRGREGGEPGLEGLAKGVVVEDFRGRGRGEEEGEEGRERGAELFERLGARDEGVGEVRGLRVRSLVKGREGSERANARI